MIATRASAQMRSVSPGLAQFNKEPGKRHTAKGDDEAVLGEHNSKGPTAAWRAERQVAVAANSPCHGQTEMAQGRVIDTVQQEAE